MNYSQRKHIERFIADAPAQVGPNPLGLGSLAGLRIVVSPDRPRYTLPAEVIPGVPWPPGFREDFNRWSAAFLGTVNNVPRGTAYALANGYIVMRPEDVVKIQTLA